MPDESLFRIACLSFGFRNPVRLKNRNFIWHSFHTINLGASSGVKPMVIALAQGAVLRRYAPNSVKFSDARLSRFEELKIGDQVKADHDREAAATFWRPTWMIQAAAGSASPKIDWSRTLAII